MRIVRLNLNALHASLVERFGPIAWGQLLDDRVELCEGSPFTGLRPSGTRLAAAEARLLAPVHPGKVIGVGRNYPAHAAEHKADVPAEPLLFLKPSSAVIGPGEPIRLPPQSQQVEHEGELAVVIGRAGRWIEAGQAGRHVLGYTIANDVTARDLQRRDPQWTRGKGFDTFCPLGPFVDTELDPTGAEVCCAVNGEVRQRGRVSEMVFSVAALVAYTSSVMTLEPGDVILTGTPSGVSPLRAGDRVTVRIDGLGELENPVRAEERP